MGRPTDSVKISVDELRILLGYRYKAEVYDSLVIALDSCQQYADKVYKLSEKNRKKSARNEKAVKWVGAGLAGLGAGIITYALLKD